MTFKIEIWASGGMADTLALGASEETREGSTPSSPREWRGRRSEAAFHNGLFTFLNNPSVETWVYIWVVRIF